MSDLAPLRVLVRVFLKGAFKIYFRSIHVYGKDRVPSEGPVLLVANHPNSLLDPAVLIHLIDRPIHFGARQPLFQTPLGPVLRAMGAIPLVRAQDEGAGMRRNLEAIETYARLLRQGAMTAIFPEGLSQDAPHLAPVKNGAARIVLKAEGSSDIRLGVLIMPVGLQFEPRRRFRSDAFVRFGEPFSVTDIVSVGRIEPRDAIKGITHRIEEALSRITLHVDSIERVPFVERLVEVYFQRAWRTGLFESGRRGLKGELLYRMAACLNYFVDTDPAAVVEVERALKRYDRLREAAGVDSRLVEERPRLLPGPLAPVQAAVEIALGAFPALFGLLTSGIPYYVTREFARRRAERSKHPPSLSVIHILVGSVVFPLAFGMEIFLVIRGLSMRLTIVFGLLLVPMGLFSLAYVQRVRKLAVHVSGRMAIWMNLQGVERVRDAQQDLLELMDTLRERFRREVLEVGAVSTRGGSGA